jgi:hypothetical protein
MCGRQAQPRAHHLSWLPREIPWTLTAAQLCADCFAHLLPRPGVHTQATWNGCGQVVGVGAQGREQKIYPRTPFVPHSVSTCGYANKTSTAIAIIAVTRSSHMFAFALQTLHELGQTRNLFFPPPHTGFPMSAHLSRLRLFQRHLRSLGWVWVWVWDWVHTPLHTLLSFSPPSFHTISLSLAFTSA